MRDVRLYYSHLSSISIFISVFIFVAIFVAILVDEDQDEDRDEDYPTKIQMRSGEGTASTAVVTGLWTAVYICAEISIMFRVEISIVGILLLVR